MKKVATLHQTDLFHLHQDPDDHWDLLCQYALANQGAIDLKGVVIDYPEDSMKGDPGVIPVGQLNYIYGLHVPNGIGFQRGQSERPSDQNGAVRLILDTLEASEEPVVIHMVGSCRDVASAIKLCPELFAEKCGGIYLNSGTSAPTKTIEYNVQLDPESYHTIHTAPCPLYWCPCFKRLGENDGRGEFSTLYNFKQGDIVPLLHPMVRRYFEYAIGRESDHRWLRYLEQPSDPSIAEFINLSERSMWSTAGILHGAGKMVTTDGDIVDIKSNPADPLFEFIPVSITCSETGETDWKPAEENTNRWIIHIKQFDQYQDVMSKALKKLLTGQD